MDSKTETIFGLLFWVAVIGGIWWWGFRDKPSEYNTDSYNSGDIVPLKYGNPVDVSDYESIDTSRSSFIEDARYNPDSEHLILDLNGTNYEYCDVPEDIWAEFQDADSLGSYFNYEIKGNYDC